MKYWPRWQRCKLSLKFFVNRKKTRRGDCSPLLFYCCRKEPCLRQRFHVYKELKTPVLLNSKQVPGIERRAVCQRSGQRNGARAQRTVESAPVWLPRRLLQCGALNGDIARA